MNKLPKSWCVKNDGSQLFKNTVVKYYNKHGNGQTCVGSSIGKYYGCMTNGKYGYGEKQEFDVELSLQEFINLTDFPEKWFIQVTEDNFSIIDKWVYDKNGYHPTPPRCVSIDATWGDRNFYEQDNYTEITIEQFRKHILKEDMKTDLLGLPIIKGDEHHLEAFVQDCEKLGYHIVRAISGKFESLSHNAIGIKEVLRNQESFTTLYLGGLSYQKDNIKTFNLPSDWSAALDFMKENMDRWNKIQEENKEPEFKVGDIIVVTEQYKNNSAKPGLITKLITISNCDNAIYEVECKWYLGNTTWCSGVRKATPQEIEEYLNKPKIFKMTSSSGDFELEVSKKGIYYRPENHYLSEDNIDSICFPVVLNINWRDRSGSYKTDIRLIDVGCKKDTLISQWKEVYDYYKSLQ